jgi:hypothetical protein
VLGPNVLEIGATASVVAYAPPQLNQIRAGDQGISFFFAHLPLASPDAGHTTAAESSWAGRAAVAKRNRSYDSIRGAIMPDFSDILYYGGGLAILGGLIAFYFYQKNKKDEE